MCGGAIIKSVDAKQAVEVDEPGEDEILMIISQNVVVYDRHKHYEKGDNKYPQLFQENNVIVGCGLNATGGEVCEPPNIVRRVDENGYDIIFRIQPPNNPSYPTPYLEKHADKILEEIQSSGLVLDLYSYKANIAVFL